MKYRKKPVVIDAVRVPADDKEWEWETFYEWAAEVGMSVTGERRTAVQTPSGYLIDTLEGTMLAGYGDWIIKGVAGEFYPCKNEVFLATYEAVEES